MKNVSSDATLSVLANANELVRHIVQEIMGDDIANTIGDSPLTKNMMYSLVQSRMRVNFARFNEVV